MRRTTDGRYAVFGVFDSEDVGRTWTISSLRASDGKVTPLFTGVPSTLDIVIAEDGVATRVISATVAGVWSVDIDGGPVVALSPPLPVGTTVFSLEVSANGQTVGFGTSGTDLGDYETWAVPVAGPPPTSPVAGPQTQPPVWWAGGRLSPDGKYVLVTGYATGTVDLTRTELFVAPVGGAPARIDGPIATAERINYGDHFVYCKATGPGLAGELRRGTYGSTTTVLIDANPVSCDIIVSADDPLADVVISGRGTNHLRVASISGNFAPWDISPLDVSAPPYGGDLPLDVSLNVKFFDGNLRILRITKAPGPSHFYTDPYWQSVARASADGRSESVLVTTSPGGSLLEVGDAMATGDFLFTYSQSREPWSVNLKSFDGGPSTVLQTSVDTPASGPPQAWFSSDDQALFLTSPGPLAGGTRLYEGSVTGADRVPMVDLKGWPGYADTFGDWLLVIDLFYDGARQGMVSNDLLLVKRNAVARSPLRSVSPVRLLDSRAPNLTVDGQFSGMGSLRAGSTTALTVAGRGGVPGDASMVVVNATVADAQEAGYLTVFPCGQPRPNASNLNFDRGATIPNLIVAKVGTGGAICMFTSAAIHLIVDANGSAPGGSSFGAQVPSRLLDSRAPGLTIDGLMSGMGRLPAGSTTELQVTGRAGVPDDGAAAVLNVTATAAQGGGYVTVYPCGDRPPNASSLNFEAGDTIANAVFATIGDSGRVCVYVSAATHLIVDIDGFVPSGSTFGPLFPARLLDSRGPGMTVDGAFSGTARLAAATVTRLPIAGRGAIPRGTGEAVLNVTVVGAESRGYVTVYPCSQTPPNASNLNFRAGQTIANAVLAKLDVNGSICVYTSASVDLIVDANGYLP